MKKNIIITAIVASVLTANSFATSIGRSGGSSHSSSSSHSTSSVSRSTSTSTYSAPSKPSVAPAPNHPGGIGGTSSSVGVRKSEVTNGVRQDIAATKPAPSGVGTTGSTHSSTAPHYTPTPSYGYAPAPQPQVTNGSTFMSSLGGSFLGSWIGTSLGSHNNGGGTTVINNGTPAASSGTITTGPAVTDSTGTVISSNQSYVQPKKEYTVWSFIADLFGAVIVIGLLIGFAWLFYIAFKTIGAYVNKERGVSNIPFQPTQKFWEIQKAFSAADVAALNTLLGPDIVDEMTMNLQPSTLTLRNVSHEVRLSNNTEFSIWFKFEDDGQEVNQVWHFEKFNSAWKLNGIENV